MSCNKWLVFASLSVINENIDEPGTYAGSPAKKKG